MQWQNQHKVSKAEKQKIDMNSRWGFSCKGERCTSDGGRKGEGEVEMREGEVRSVVFCWLRNERSGKRFSHEGLGV